MFMDEHEVASSLHSVAKHSHIIESKFTSEGKVGSFQQKTNYMSLLSMWPTSAEHCEDESGKTNLV